ncbi:hypothetical protein O9H85_12920 [Paenibacillus filicis]|uniref:Uncharacterized protein n=1 Tax=Paenibacillus gyeongsangnamensis TaxID=3388067 RepID=A0ABT4Q8V6_9BACL|nr:hypothetical protein [Paenibacillus filicis]MCZ8513311.1 hypothetical protein [Paenibacillus filicis]
MDPHPNENVILFPKTVEFYQYELTRLLEAERYGEAMEALRFLLACHTDDERAREEWQSLLDWLQMMFPDVALGIGRAEGEEPTEADLLREILAEKTSRQEDYAAKLLQTLMEQQAIDKRLLALDQLAFIDAPGIDEALLDWLTDPDRKLHPILQFKTLQTLKKRGVSGTVKLPRNGETFLAEIEETPASFDQFPSQIQEIITRVQEISETQHPALSYFAEETWSEFLAFVYGTSAYRQMLRQDAAYVDVWAAALHLTLLERVFDGGNKEELQELYGITDEMSFQWEQAYRIMQQFASAVFTKRL